jgi:hypothetical protein
MLFFAKDDVAGVMPAWIPLACYTAIALGTLRVVGKL